MPPLIWPIDNSWPGPLTPFLIRCLRFSGCFPTTLRARLYLESVRWREGFACPRCQSTAAPTRIAKPGVLRCKGCKRDIALTAGTIMERPHTPLSTWFWAAFLVSSLTPGMSAVQLQRQLGLT